MLEINSIVEKESNSDGYAVFETLLIRSKQRQQNKALERGLNVDVAEAF